MLTLAEYLRELKLMKQQYGQEEELYPLIYMLLRESLKKELSLRTVANGKIALLVPGSILLNGFGAFPDLVIVGTDFDNSLCMTKDELDEIKKSLNINSEKGQRISGADKQKVVDKIKEINTKKLKNQTRKMYGCVEVKAFVGKPKKLLEGFSGIENGEYRLSCLIAKTKEYVNEFIYELFWYGRVLYTNGIKWYYFELSNRKYRRIKINSFFQNEDIDFNENPKVKCAEIGNLQPMLDAVISPDAVDGYVSEHPDCEQKWERLIKNLAKINWTGTTDFSEFINREFK